MISPSFGPSLEFISPIPVVFLVFTGYEFGFSFFDRHLELFENVGFGFCQLFPLDSGEGVMSVPIRLNLSAFVFNTHFRVRTR